MSIRAQIETAIADAEPFEPDHGLLTQRLDKVETKPIQWFWRDRIPAGSICLLMGMPNQGKSTLTCDIIARVTNGTGWPIGEDRKMPSGNVAILTGEESIEQVVAPRCKAAGADLSKVHAISGVRRVAEDETAAGFDIGLDVARLDALARSIGGLALVVVDPLDSYLGGGMDVNRGNVVREAMRPLRDWADKSGTTVVIVHHLNKSQSTNATDRVSGARSFAAMPRSIWMIAQDRDAGPGVNRSILAPLKWNLSPTKPPATSYEIIPSQDDPAIPVIAWMGDSIDADADSLLRRDSDDSEPSAREEAIEFLRETLSHGPKLARDVKREARDLGIAEATLNRSKEAAGVKVKQMRDSHRIVGWAWEIAT